MTNDGPRGISYESEHVHQVYEQIASHFSSTRYKPWPVVERFLLSLAPGSIGLDVGCGNGKYLAVNKDIFILASDRSTNLVKIAKQHSRHAALVADTLDLPHPVHSFDFAISIAVIHHLSTPERRVEALAAILVTLRRARGAEAAGKALIFVWALEQKGSRRGWDVGDEQDVMVPWVMKGGNAKMVAENDRPARPHDAASQDLDGGEAVVQDRTFYRYYHLYKDGELQDNILKAGGVVLESGYERDNWWAVMAPAG